MLDFEKKEFLSRKELKEVCPVIFAENASSEVPIQKRIVTFQS